MSQYFISVPVTLKMGVTIYRIHVDAKKNLYQKNFHEEDCFYPQKQIEAFL